MGQRLGRLLRRHCGLVAGGIFFVLHSFLSHIRNCFSCFSCAQDWTKPVGYHVTVPCSKDEAGYRVFDSVFAVDRTNEYMDVVRIRYTHTMMRDQEAYHSR